VGHLFGESQLRCINIAKSGSDIGFLFISSVVDPQQQGSGFVVQKLASVKIVMKNENGRRWAHFSAPKGY
jgi:hypothetical protein